MDITRSTVLTALDAFFANMQYSAPAADSVIGRSGLTGADKNLFMRLYMGVIERKLTLDYYISRLLENPEKRLNETLANILRMGLYQLAFTDRIPQHAACDTCVELARERRLPHGFVNAVLRGFIRRGDEIRAGILGLPRTERLSVEYSIAPYIIELWDAQYGREACLALLGAANKAPPLSLTVNTLKIARDTFLETLRADGCDAAASDYSPLGVIVRGKTAVRDLSGYDEGWFFVQDAASQMCAGELCVPAGAMIADTCAAPGGKSFYAAILNRGGARINAFDLRPNKIRRIAEGAERLGLDCISAQCRDATEGAAPVLAGKAAAVICDVPCSGLGVIAKKPEIKYKNKSDLERLPEIQYNILDASASYVAPGGVLMYSTCTLNKNENEDVVNRFLAGHPEYEPAEFTSLKSESRGMATIFPYEHEIDGFFFVKMVKCRS